MRYLTFSTLLLILGVSAHGQNKIDSLFIAKYNSTALSYFLSKPDSSLSLASKALSLAEKNNFKFQIADSYYVISRAHWTKTNYQLSAQYGYKALKLYENSGYTQQWGKCLLALARTFCDLKDYSQARSYINQAHKLVSKQSDNKLLAEVMREKSFLLTELKKYDSALLCTNQGIDLYEKSGDSLDASVLYSRKARILLEQKKFTESLPYIYKSILIDSLVKNRRGLAVGYFQAAQVAFQLGETEKALALLKNGDRIGKELNNLSNRIRMAKLRVEIYKQKKQKDSVIHQLELIDSYKQNLFNTERNGQIQEMKSLYELEEKDHLIKLLENQNSLEKQKSKNQQIILISGGIVLILLVALSFVFWKLRQYQKKVNEDLALKNQEIELQNEEIQSQADSLHTINQLKSKILSVISHDLRAPINNLYSLLELVTKNIMTPEEFGELSIKLKSNLNVTQRTLENLLNWSLGQMEGIKTIPIAFNINSVIEDVAHLSEEAANRKQILFKKDGKVPLFVMADVNQVHLILRNLFNNAIKFSKHESEVIITVEVRNKSCYVYIQDKGIGMTQAEIEMITTSNEYFTKTGTDQEKGTGLGLLLCKEFIKRNSGEFFIESKLKEGTLVTFSLPLA